MRRIVLTIALLLAVSACWLLPLYAGRSFNGSSDIINVPSTGNALDISTGPEVISFWMYPTTIPGTNDHYPLSDYGSQGQFVIGFGACGGGCSTAGVLGFAEGTNFSLTGVRGSCGTYTANTWYQVTYYVDPAGTLQGSPTAGMLVSGGTSCTSIQSFRENRVAGIGLFQVGGANNGDFFQGVVAEVAVWNVLMTAGQMTALQTVCPTGASARRMSLPNPVGYLPLYGVHSPEPDLSGNKYNGTLTGTAAANHPPCTP